MSQRFNSVAEYIDYHIGRGVSEERLREHFRTKHNLSPERVDGIFSRYYQSKAAQPAAPQPPASPAPPVREHAAVPQKQKKVRKHLKAPSKKLALAAAAVMLAPVIFYTSLNAFIKFKPISYENGLGATYQMTFYSKNDLVKEPIPLLENDQKERSQQLKSNYSLAGQAPFTMGIKSYPAENDTEYKLALARDDCSSTDGSVTKVLSVYNGAAKKDVHICSVSSKAFNGGQSEAVYAATFTDGVNKHHVTFIQRLDDGKPGLQAYHEDIKTIVSSIKPIVN